MKLLEPKYSRPSWCSQVRWKILLEVSPTYFHSFIPSILFLFSSSPRSSSSIIFSSLLWQSRHQISYTADLLWQSWLWFLLVIDLVAQSMHFFLQQSLPCQGSDLWRISSNLVPALSTTLSLYPVRLPSFSSASLIFTAKLLWLVNTVNMTAKPQAGTTLPDIIYIS